MRVISLLKNIKYFREDLYVLGRRKRWIQVVTKKKKVFLKQSMHGPITKMSPKLPRVINYPFESKVTFPSIIKFHFFHSHFCRFLNIHHSFLSCISPEIMKFQIIFLRSPFSSSSNHCFRLRLFIFL